MNPILILSNVMQAASFASAIVLLVLQVRTFRRHHHVSFALLTASTVAAILYFVIWQVMAQLAYKALPTPVWLYACAAAFLLFQIVFGTWGTISLFNSYRQLSQRVGGAENTVHTLQAVGDSARAILQVPQTPGLGTHPVNSKPTLLQRGLQQLTGENLSAALQASGIKRRIIVISACHAGAFIPQLKNPDTFTITAAAADKTSFGCSDDRDLTYFGEAFYRDALPKAQNLQDAFKQAKEAIAIRETQEHQKPSDPQAHFGSDLQRDLDANPMTPPSAR